MMMNDEVADFTVRWKTRELVLSTAIQKSTNYIKSEENRTNPIPSKVIYQQ